MPGPVIGTFDQRYNKFEIPGYNMPEEVVPPILHISTGLRDTVDEEFYWQATRGETLGHTFDYDDGFGIATVFTEVSRRTSLALGIKKLLHPFEPDQNRIYKVLPEPIHQSYGAAVIEYCRDNNIRQSGAGLYLGTWSRPYALLRASRKGNE
jgi:hypothetical protein